MNLLDDTPIVPGDARPAFAHEAQARQVLVDAEDDLREWAPQIEEVVSQSEGMGTNLMPSDAATGSSAHVSEETAVEAAAKEDVSTRSNKIGVDTAGEGAHLKESIATPVAESSASPSSTVVAPGTAH